MSDYRISYSQNREDILLDGFLKKFKKGFYVDVGANYPDQLSITKLFYEKGWHGINLEPNPHLYRLIVAQRKRDINLNVGAADKSGSLTLREYPNGDGLSTFSKESQQEYQKQTSEYKQYTNDYKDYSVPVKTLAEIFSENNVGTIHFMNVDVEGFEYEVLKGNDWEKYRPYVICIEANHIVHDWRPLLAKAKYTLAFNDGLNNYYVADEHHELMEEFSYVQTVLLDRPVVAAHVAHELQILENHIARQDLTAYNLRLEIDRLSNYIASQARLRAAVRQVGVSIHRIILLRIERLNKSKPRYIPPLKLSDKLSAEERLDALESYDTQLYYGMKIRQPRAYRFVLVTYLGFARTTYKVLRAMFRGLRRVAHV